MMFTTYQLAQSEVYVRVDNETRTTTVFRGKGANGSYHSSRGTPHLPGRAERTKPEQKTTFRLPIEHVSAYGNTPFRLMRHAAFGLALHPFVRSLPPRLSFRA